MKQIVVTFGKSWRFAAVWHCEVFTRVLLCNRKNMVNIGKIDTFKCIYI